jgi:hypothetical protein
MPSLTGPLRVQLQREGKESGFVGEPIFSILAVLRCAALSVYVVTGLVNTTRGSLVLNDPCHPCIPLLSGCAGPFFRPTCHDVAPLVCFIPKLWDAFERRVN